MPSGNNNGPRRQLRTWDKLTLYTLVKLTCDSPGGYTWFSVRAIKEKATELIRAQLAHVSSHPGAVGMVTSCLNRFVELGVVITEAHGRQRRARLYKIVRSAENDALHDALCAEVAAEGSFNWNNFGTNRAYSAVRNNNRYGRPLVENAVNSLLGINTARPTRPFVNAFIAPAGLTFLNPVSPSLDFTLLDHQAQMHEAARQQRVQSETSGSCLETAYQQKVRLALQELD